MSELKEKAIKAAARFLTHRGYEVIEAQWKSDSGSSLDLVAREDGTVVFVDVYARHGIEKGMPDGGGETSRERREIAAAAWLSEHAGDDDLRVSEPLCGQIIIDKEQEASTAFDGFDYLVMDSDFEDDHGELKGKEVWIQTWKS